MLEDLELLKRNEFNVVDYGWARTKPEAHMIAQAIGYPVALKIISERTTHKTDVGGVKVNIKNAKALEIAYDEIEENARKFNVEIKGVLVQKMARKGLELIVGGKKDEQFGEMIVLGLGGIYVEVFRDITARLCPIEKEDVKEMVHELKSHPILEGMRGKKGISMKGLEELLMKTCRLMKKENIEEIDINPVIFDEIGYDIVDVRIKR